MGSDDDSIEKAKVIKTALKPAAEEFAEASKGAGAGHRGPA